MPEGPEVTIITNQLSKLLKSQKLIGINILTTKKYAINKSIENIKLYMKLPVKLIDVRKKGKFIYFWFANDLIIGSTLGLSGGYTLDRSNQSLIEFIFEKNKLYYNDVRHFGTFQIMSLSGLNNKLDKIGPDILTGSIRPQEKSYLEKDEATVEKFVAKTKKYPAKQIVQILVDQKIISGIGNYLKSEILYKAKMFPGKLIKQISVIDLKRLYDIARMISNNSLENGGVSIRDYQDIYGKKGKYHPTIYGKKKIDDKPVLTKTFKDLRTTYYLKYD